MTDVKSKTFILPRFPSSFSYLLNPILIQPSELSQSRSYTPSCCRLCSIGWDDYIAIHPNDRDDTVLTAWINMCNISERSKRSHRNHSETIAMVIGLSKRPKFVQGITVAFFLDHGKFADCRASPRFHAIETTIWKPIIVPIVLIVQETIWKQPGRFG